MSTFSFASSIFNRALDTIEEHQSRFIDKGYIKGNFKQALDWWDSLPEFAQKSLHEHSFLNKTTNQGIRDFYWGE